jgi:hypothetical protein
MAHLRNITIATVTLVIGALVAVGLRVQFDDGDGTANLGFPSVGLDSSAAEDAL